MVGAETVQSISTGQRGRGWGGRDRSLGERSGVALVYALTPVGSGEALRVCSQGTDMNSSLSEQEN